MARHELKTWPEFFDATFKRRKMFDVRKNDRDYRVGDIVILRRFDPKTKTYTGGFCGREIGYVLEGGQFGIEAGYVVLGFSDRVDERTLAAEEEKMDCYQFGSIG